MAAIEIETTYDETGLQEGLNKAKKALSDFQKEVDNIGGKGLFDKMSNDPAIARIQVNMVKLADKIRETNSALENEVGILNILEDSYKKALAAGDAEKVKDLTEALRKQQKVVEDLQAQNAGYASTLGNMYKQLEKAQGGFNKMGGAARVLRTVAMGLPPELRQVTSALTGVGTAAAQGARTFGVWGAAIAVAAKLASVALAEIKKRQEEATRTAEEWRKEASTSAAVQVAAFQKLRQEYAALGDSEQSRAEWLKQNKENIDELGVSVNNTADAEDMFINHADDFVKSIEARAKAAAYMKVASDQYASYIDKMLQAEQLRDFRKNTGPNFGDYAKGFFQTKAPLGSPLFVPSLIEAASVNQSERENKQATEIEEEAKKVWEKAQTSLKKYFEQNGLASLIFDAGTSSTNGSGSAAVLNIVKDIQSAERKLKEYNETSGKEGIEKEKELALLRNKFIVEDIEARYAANKAIAKSEKEQADAKRLYDLETEVEVKRHAAAMKELDDRAAQETISANEKQINEWKKFGDEVVRIQQERQQKLKALSDNKGLTDEQRAAGEAEINAYTDFQLDEAASKLGADIKGIQDMLTDALDLSIQQIISSLEEIKPTIEGLDLTGDLDEGQLKLVAKYNALLTALAQKWGLVGKNEKKTNADTKKDFKDTMQVLSDVKDVVGNIAEALDDWLSESEKSALSAIQNISTSTIAMIGAIQELSKEAAEDIKQTERASAILTAISAAIQIIGYVSKVISANSDNAQALEHAEHFLKVAQGTATLWERIYNKASTDTGGAGADYWAEQARLINKSYVQVAAYEDAVNSAQKAVDKLWNSWLVSDKKEEEAREKLEAAKGEYYKALKEYQSRWNELYNEFLGATPESLASTLAGAIVDGFAEGLDESERIWDESIDDMMRKALTQQLARQLTDVFQDTFKRITAGGYFDDGMISATEAADIRKSLDEAKERGQQYIDLAKQISDTLGLDDEERINADTGSLAQASQDSIDLLTGIATSIQGLCLNMDNSLRSVAQNNADALVVLRAIQSDTARLAAIENGIYNIRETFADVQTRGIKVNMN